MSTRKKDQPRSQLLDKVVDIASEQLPAQIDVTDNEVYLLFAAFCGDVERTAHAAGVTPMDVIEMRDAGKWDEKLRAIIELKNSARPGDVERAVHRAINLVQAHRLRMILENFIRILNSMPISELLQYNKDGVMQTRAIADLASALEKCHSMVYQATGDTSTERRARNDDTQTDGASLGAIHAKIAAQMGKTVRVSKSVQEPPQPPTA